MRYVSLVCEKRMLRYNIKYAHILQQEKFIFLFFHLQIINLSQF